ncbi:MAG: DUF3685 domain-containing protein [Pseudanabaenaceae cyanobacterium bins.68]|nr:DUF3685 domain-containing protein [Pseudanabaenaceae cyanobacterium bins.68]
MIQIFLIEPNLLFRLGLKLHLQQSGKVNLVGEAASLEQALQALDQMGQADVLVMGLDYDWQWRWCERLRFRYAETPILLILAQPSGILIRTASQWGIEGICSRTSSPGEILTALAQLATGATYRSEPQPKSQPRASLWAFLRTQLYGSGVAEIDQALAELAGIPSGGLGRYWLEGRRRELAAARWLLQQIYGVRSEVLAKAPGALVYEPRELVQQEERGWFDRVAVNLQSSLVNLTDQPLEIEVLNLTKRQELLFIAMRQFEDLCERVQREQLSDQAIAREQLIWLQNLWLQVAEEFWSRLEGFDSDLILKQTRADAAVVQREILSQVYLLPELLGYIIDRTPIKVIPGFEPAMIDQLISHLLIQVANGVVSPLLNHFSDRLELQQQLFELGYTSTREMERFRNDLSWRYRLQSAFQQPRAIFEGRYAVFTLTADGITTANIAAPRQQELVALKGIAAWYTLALELQDAIAPRLRTLGAFVGKAFVYVLTNLVGRGLGLVGKGIIQGIGNAWREPRPRIKRD